MQQQQPQQQQQAEQQLQQQAEQQKQADTSMAEAMGDPMGERIVQELGQAVRALEEAERHANALMVTAKKRRLDECERSHLNFVEDIKQKLKAAKSHMDIELTATADEWKATWQQEHDTMLTWRALAENWEILNTRLRQDNARLHGEVAKLQMEKDHLEARFAAFKATAPLQQLSGACEPAQRPLALPWLPEQ